MVNTKDIAFAARCIREGRLVAFPTETVYGLGADALNAMAVARIFEAKQRPSFDPLIVHIADIADLERLTGTKDERVFALAEKFWPGPLTMVLPKTSIVPDIVTSGLSTVGIRMPAHPLALELITGSGCPIAAPSANLFGRISPTKASHVKKQLPGIDCILDGGKTAVGIESSIIRLTSKGFQILRNGILSREDIASVLPFDATPLLTEDAAAMAGLPAPGMIQSHYSPVKKMLIASPSFLAQTDTSTAGLISFTGNLEKGFGKIIRVSSNADLKEYAANMFEAMHAFEDDPGIEFIVAEPVPETGIGIAIMEKLRKATFNWNR